MQALSGAIKQSDLFIISLPRLKLTFQARCNPSGAICLFSVDHADLFITNEVRSPRLHDP